MKYSLNKCHEAYLDLAARMDEKFEENDRPAMAAMFQPNQCPMSRRSSKKEQKAQTDMGRYINWTKTSLKKI